MFTPQGHRKQGQHRSV